MTQQEEIEIIYDVCRSKHHRFTMQYVSNRQYSIAGHRFKATSVVFAREPVGFHHITAACLLGHIGFAVKWMKTGLNFIIEDQTEYAMIYGDLYENGNTRRRSQYLLKSLL